MENHHVQWENPLYINGPCSSSQSVSHNQRVDDFRCAKLNQQLPLWGWFLICLPYPTIFQQGKWQSEHCIKGESHIRSSLTSSIFGTPQKKSSAGDFLMFR